MKRLIPCSSSFNNHRLQLVIFYEDQIYHDLSCIYYCGRKVRPVSCTAFQARPILRDKDRLEELADSTLGGKYPKEDFVRVCTIAAACVAPEANQRPTMGEVVQSLKMVQRVTEYQDSMLASSNNRPNLRQSSTTFESDGTSSMFSSGPYSGLSTFDNDNISRTAVFSEDLHEGR
jgi:hypothetical protein